MALVIALDPDREPRFRCLGRDSSRSIAVATAFVGRKDELDTLVRGLSDSIGGRGRLFLISGDAGVGKTRLADEVAEQARDRGALVMWGSSFDDVSAPSYWPWIQMLRTVLHSNEIMSSLPATARAATSILRLIPELRTEIAAQVPQHAVAGQDDFDINETAPDVQRFRLFDAIATILKGAATVTPLLLVLDDLHSVDSDSLLLLKFVAREIRSHRILAIGIHRKADTEESSRSLHLLSAIAREGTPLPLFGFRESEVADFVQAVTGRTPDNALLEKLLHRTQGNAFFLEETMRSVPPGGALRSDVPEGVRLTVERSLESLREPVRALLRIASAIGGEFDVPLLTAASGAPVDEVIAMLSEAAAQGVIVKGPGALHPYRFRHGVVAETIYQTLPKLDAMRLHLQIAHASEGLYQDHDARSAQLAHHYSQALPLGPADKVVAFCEKAALRARGSCAYEDATRLFQTALNAAEIIRPPDAKLRLTLLKQLGEVSFAAGLFAKSRAWFNQAAQIARELGDYEEVARLVLGFVATPSESGTVDHSRVRLLKEALGLLGESDSSLRARLTARLAWELYWSEPAESVTSLTDSALEIARRLHDDETLIEVLYYRHHATWSPDNVSERLAITAELIERCADPKYYLWAMRAHYLRVVDLLELGNLSAAREEIERYSSIAEESGFSIGYGELSRASCCLIEGKLEQGERWAERALQIGLRQELRGRRHREAYTFYMLSLRREQGRSEEMGTIAQRLSSTARLPVVRAILATYYLETGNLPSANVEFDRLVAGGLNQVRRDSIWLVTMALAAQASASLKDRERSEQLYEMLLPYADRSALLDIYVSYGPVAYYLGLLAVQLGRVEESRAHFERALESCERSGALLFLAQTLAAYASMLLELRNETETANARRLIDRGLNLADALGLTAASLRLRNLQVAGDDHSGDQDRAERSACVFVKDGDDWTISFDRKPAFRVSDSKGMEYLARLLRSPAIQIHALDLVSGETSPSGNRQSAAFAQMSQEQLSEVGMSRELGSDAGEMLDQQAKAQYAQRLRDISELLKKAKSLEDVEAASALEDEQEMLMRELSRAVGLKGKDRRAASDAERARINVNRALKSAIGKIAEKDPELGLHLSKAVRTGTYCSYAPVSDSQFVWRS